MTTRAPAVLEKKHGLRVPLSRRRTEFHAIHEKPTQNHLVVPANHEKPENIFCREFFSASRRTGSDAMKRFAQLLIALDLLGIYRDATALLFRLLVMFWGFTLKNRIWHISLLHDNWSKSIFLENKLVINFDFRQGAKNQVIWSTRCTVMAKYISIYFDIFYKKLV